MRWTLAVMLSACASSTHAGGDQPDAAAGGGKADDPHDAAADAAPPQFPDTLEHVGKLYRVIGGQSATSVDPGSCGGGEYNRMILHVDAALHDAQLAANTRKGATPYDLADIPSTSFWRDSHDVGGPHAPF